MVDHIRYDLLTQQALRGVVRTVLADAVKKGLPGEHHFYITFDTQADGVRMSQRLRAQYPEEMTIILQHQFWDLAVNDQTFEVGLSFGGVPERLTIPFEAVRGFFDPSVQFGLQFEEAGDGLQDNASPAASSELKAGEKPKRRSPPPPAAQGSAPSAAAPAKGEPPAPAAANPEPDRPAAGAEVVRLDRFRKK
jgi:hypothetical protein